MNDSAHWLDRIAHDLRGPLTPLQTAAWLLKSEGEHLDAQRQAELLDIIERQSRRLARMIDEFDDWSRAQQRRLLGESMPCELATMLDLAISAIPGCMIEPVLAPDCIGASLDCDQFRLVQAFKILIEYSTARDPGATLQVVRDGDALLVRLLDRGTPLDAASVSMLLLQPDATPGNEGLGLRLLLARAIVEAHGGTLVAESTLDGMLLCCRIRAVDGERT